MREKFSLRYAGPQLRSGMEAEEVAAAIEGFAAIARIGGASIFGSEPHIEFKLRSVEPGSLVLSFLMEVGGSAKVLVSALPGPSVVVDFFKLFQQWYSLLKHLNGKPPQSVQKTKGNGTVQVQNSKGDVKIFQSNVYNTFNYYDVGRHAEKVVRPLRRHADSLDIRVRGKTAATVDKDEAAAFRSVRQLEATLERRSEVFLKVVAPVFEGQAMWRFSSGRNIITAAVDDPAFLADVQTGQESFRAGDILKVRLFSVQERIGDKIKDRHVVEAVLAHERPTAKEPRFL